MAKIDVILCDDHPLILDALEKLINAQSDMRVLAKVSSVAALTAVLESGQNALVLLDFSLPDGDGLTISKKFSKAFDIIGFTGIEDISVIKHFMKSGARGYLSKDADNDEILIAMRQVASGNDYLRPDIAMALATNQSVKPAGSYIPKLSMRELDVLRLIIDEFTTQEIADKLFISVNTVETHRNHLMQKLGAKNLAGMVRIALEKGLV